MRPATTRLTLLVICNLEGHFRGVNYSLTLTNLRICREKGGGGNIHSLCRILLPCHHTYSQIRLCPWKP